MKKFYGRLKQCLYCLLLVLATQNVFAQPVCPPNIDFEFGNFSNWQLFAGSTTASGGLNYINVSPSAQILGRHTLVPNTPPTTPTDPFGGFSMGAPNGSGYSVRLGNNQTNGEAERITYQFTIPAGSTEYSLVYQYAVVLQDPGHAASDQPRFNAKVIDVATGDYISCASFEFVATANLPGFQQSPSSSLVWYKTWTPVTINLSGYGGKTVVVEFTTADCTQGAHWGYAYVDVNVGCSSPVSGVDFCPGNPSITLTAPHGYQTYTWYTTINSNTIGTLLSNQQNLVVTPPPTDNTVYAVVLTPYAGFGCSDTIFATANALPMPVADAGPDRLLCTATGTQIGTPAVPGHTYSWSPAAGLSDATAAQPMALPGSTTDYILTVTSTNGGCEDKDTVKVTVNTAFSTAFTVTPGITQCLAGNNFQFNINNAPGLTYSWDFGVPGGTSTLQNPSFVYTDPGTYTVKVRVSASNGCIDSSMQTMTVHPMPVADAGPDRLLCGGTATQAVIGTPAVAGLTYSWSPAAGLSNASIAEPTASPTTSTTYILTVTGTGGCIDKDTVVVNVTPTISPSFTINTPNQCLWGNNYQFTANPSNPSGLNYAWTFGDPENGTSTLQNPTYQFQTAGTYTVELVVSASGGTCVANSTQTVVISPSPVADAGGDQMLCGGTNSQVVIGTPAISGYTYSWSPSTGLSNASIAQPSASPTTTTNYIVTVTGAGGCITKDTVNVLVTNTLSPGFNVNDLSQCVTGNNFQFNMSSPIGGLTYAWTFGDGGTSTQQNPSYQYTTAGNWNVKVIVSTPNGCKDSSNQTVTVSAVPVASISSTETNICEGTPVQLTATGTPAGSYKWYKDGTVVATTTTNTFNATLPGTYTFELDNGCINAGTGSVTLTITKKPTVDFSYQTMCLGYPTPFTDNSNVAASLPVNYSWDFGNTSIPGSTQPSPTITYGAAGNYNVLFTVTPQACPQLATTAQKNVEIKGPVAGILLPEAAAMENMPAQLNARAIGNSYLWSPGTSLSATNIKSPIFQGMADQLYTITVTNDIGCVTVDTLQVKVYKEVNIYVPKAFTPNNDGVNDHMFPFVVGIREIKVFRIINRWGVVVFQTKDANPGWDGKYKGAAQPMDGYVWEIQAIDYFGKSHTRQGSFTLIR